MRVETEVIKQTLLATDFDAEIDNLPYLFVDTHKLDKKIDVKKLRYGSRIDASGNHKREEFFTVKEVIDVDKVRLNNDLIVRLLGVKKNPAVNGEAEKFLSDKTKGKRVFLRFDNQKYDGNDNLLGYLYLENKTFINAHLIKHGFALADTNTDYKYKSKFLIL
jgi:site-specific DNA-methyltransferase (adenine-specific)